MELSLVGNEISVFEKTYEQLFRKEETLDCVVPDTMPDIGEILDTVPTLYIRSKDVSGGRVRLEAECAATVLYIPEGEEGIRELNVTVPFFISAEDAGISEFSRCLADLSLTSAEAKMLNSRKIFVKAEASVLVTCCEERTTSVTTDIVSDQPVCKRSEELVLTPVTAVEEKSFVITEEYPIPASRGEISKIVCRTVTLTPGEVKSVGTKIVFRGEISTSLCYLTPDGAPEGLDYVSSFSQVVETGSEREIARCSLLLTPSAFYADVHTSGAERSIAAEVHIVAQLCCREERRISCLADAYSNSFTLTPELEDREYRCVKGGVSLRETVRETLQCESVVSCRLCAGRPVVTGGEVRFDAELRVLCVGSDGRLSRFAKTVGVKTATDIAACEELFVESISCGEASVSPSAGGAELRLPLTIEAAVYEKCAAKNICALETSEDEGAADAPSAVMLRAASSDSLWELAKANRSTVEAIKEANGLDDAPEKWEKFIFIPCRVR